MTGHNEPLARAELAGLLSDAAQSVSEILTTEYPTPPGRSYLHPVLGALSAGPRVVRELNDQLEQFVADESLPTTPAGLLALASYASALGWLTESLAELTASVDQICTRVGIPAQPPDSSLAQPATTERDNTFGIIFSAPELEAIRAAAEAADLPPGDYIEVLSASLLAASTITDACMEISNALLEDAAYVLGEAADHVHIGNGPDGLPTLVRSLLARLEAAG